jgi:hypothetical protein
MLRVWRLREPDAALMGPIEARQAIVYERFEDGSKKVVRTRPGKNGIGEATLVGRSEYLNQRSIEDLRRISQVIEEKKIRIHDLQFMIAKDGRVVISDPGNVLHGIEPSGTNRKTIQLLIGVAEDNVKRKGR